MLRVLLLGALLLAASATSDDSADVLEAINELSDDDTRQVLADYYDSLEGGGDSTADVGAPNIEEWPVAGSDVAATIGQVYKCRLESRRSVVRLMCRCRA